MKTICAWCLKSLKEAEIGEDPNNISHGICLDCEKKMIDELVSLEEGL